MKIILKELLLLMLYMMNIHLREESMMKEHFLLLNQLCKVTMVQYLPMDKLDVVRHIQCLVLREINLRMVSFQMHLTIYSVILMMQKT